MIEPIMYMGIGFLVAGLLVIGAIPLVHARAVRLTMKRLEAMTPMSMSINKGRVRPTTQRAGRWRKYFLIEPTRVAAAMRSSRKRATIRRIVGLFTCQNQGPPNNQGGV